MWLIILKMQVTLFDKNKVYRPLSTLIEVDDVETANQKELINKAYQQIASKKYMTSTELFEQGYQKAKIREYDAEKIKQENMIKYFLKKKAKEKSDKKC